MYVRLLFICWELIGEFIVELMWGCFLMTSARKLEFWHRTSNFPMSQSFILFFL